MKLRALSVIMLAAFVAAPLPAKPYVAANYSASNYKGKTIAVFRPDVQVGSYTAGGVEEPNAEWTAQARERLAAAIEAQQGKHDNKLIFLDKVELSNPQLIAEYQSLFRATTNAMMATGSGRLLPTKKGKASWSLGPETARLREITGADAGLFFFVHDAYGTAGRKTAQLFLAMAGVGIIAGIHVSYAAFVDFSTGQIMWMNMDPMSGGDPRTDVGAVKRVGQVLSATDFDPAVGGIASR